MDYKQIFIFFLLWREISYRALSGKIHGVNNPIISGIETIYAKCLQLAT